MNNKNLITVAELTKLLLAQKGAMPITIEALVEVRARKTGNPYDAILKFSTVNGFTGHDYEASVNRQRVREGSNPDFVQHDRSWGTNVNNILSQKGDKYYLRIRPLHTSEPTYFVRQGKTLKQVAKSVVEAFLPPVYPSKVQATDTEILHREYLVTNLRSVTFGGVRYEVVHQ
jgi:hypothetical protein